MRFNQVNNNKGDVNNAVADGGNVFQSVGNKGDVNNAAASGGNTVQSSSDNGRVRIEQPKESFWAQLWAKVRGLWKGLFG